MSDRDWLTIIFIDSVHIVDVPDSLTPMSTHTDITTAQWRVAIAQAIATVVVSIVKVETPTSDAYSPRARERLASQRGSWERGVRTHWVLQVTVLGCDISEEIGYTAGRFETKKAAAAYDVIADVEEELWSVRDSRNLPLNWEQALAALAAEVQS